MPDTNTIRRQFPILAQEGLVYLDTAATSQKPLAVIEAMDDFLRTDYSNIHRGAHFLGDRATEKYEAVRQKVAGFLNAASPREIVFTKNATESINLVARSLGEMEGFFEAGDRIVISRMEHHANLVPWLQLAKRRSLEVAFLELNEARELILDNLDELLAKPTKLLAVTHVSNVLGTRVPVEELCAKARKYGVTTLIDGCQAVPHFAVDVQKIGCDFYAFSGHKAYGPSGVGVLYGRKDLLNKMPPFLGGGEMIREVSYTGFTPAEIPHKFEAGTPPIVEVYGLGAAIDFIGGIGIDNIERHGEQISALARELLSQIPEITILSHQNANGLITFSAKGVQNYDISDSLSDRGICVRVGHHCAEPLHVLLGQKTSLRASFGIYTSPEEVKQLAKRLQEGIQSLGL